MAANNVSLSNASLQTRTLTFSTTPPSRIPFEVVPTVSDEDDTNGGVTTTVRNISISLIALWFVAVTVMTVFSMYRRRKKAEARAAARRAERAAENEIPMESLKYFLPPPSYEDCVADPPTYEEAVKYIKNDTVIIHM